MQITEPISGGKLYEGRAESTRGRRAKPVRKRPLRINVERRARLEALVQNIIDLLDELDGDTDDEPSLGALEDHPGTGTWRDRSDLGSQERWGSSAVHDSETDPGESGVGDIDGLIEQYGRQQGQQFI